MVLERIGARVPQLALDNGRLRVNWGFADKIPCSDLGRVEDCWLDSSYDGHFGQRVWGVAMRSRLGCAIELVTALLVG